MKCRMLLDLLYEANSPSMALFTHKKARSLMGVGFSPESNALILFNGRKINVIL